MRPPPAAFGQLRMFDAKISGIRDQYDQLFFLQQLKRGIDRLPAEIQLPADLALGADSFPDQHQ